MLTAEAIINAIIVGLLLYLHLFSIDIDKLSICIEKTLIGFKYLN